MTQNFKFFLKGTVLISFGTIISQIIMLVALPFLTRIYTPDDFGIYGVYLFLFSLFSVLASFRYEQGVPITKYRSGAIYLVLISIVLSIFTGLGIVLLGSVLKLIPVINDSFMVSNFILIVLLAIAVMFAGCYKVLEFWAVRERQYREIAYAKVVRSIGLVCSQILFGLIEGHWVGQLAGGFRFLIQYVKVFRRNIKTLSRRKVLWAFKRYKDFPKYDLWAVLVDVISSQSPILFFMIFYSAEIAGYFMLALALLSAPVTLIGKAVSQVLLSHSKDENGNEDYIKALYLKVFKLLTKISIIPFFIIMLIPEDFFVWLLGEGWLGAGVVIFWTAVWVMFQFIFSPLSILFAVQKAQIKHRNLQIYFFFLRAASLFVPYILGATSEESLIVFSIVNLLCYVFAIYYVLNLIDISLVASLKIIILELLLGLGLFVSMMLVDINSIVYPIIIGVLLIWSVMLWKEVRSVEL